MDFRPESKVQKAIEGDENTKIAGSGIVEVNKSPGPTGYTLNSLEKFGRFYCRIFSEAVEHFTFNMGLSSPKGCNSSLIALIPKSPGCRNSSTTIALLVLIRVWEIDSSFGVRSSECDERLTPSIKLPFKLESPISNEDIRTAVWGCGVDKSPGPDGFTFEFFRIFKGYKIDPSTTLSHLFYADDAVFIGEWSHSNLKGIMNILRCFSLLSGMSINIQKSHLLGVDGPCSFPAAFNFDMEFHHNRSNSFKVKVRTSFPFFLFPRLFALEENKNISVADKMNTSISSSFRRHVRGGIESQQLDQLSLLLDTIILSNMDDRWFWDLNGDGIFQVKDVRSMLNEAFLPKNEVLTRWIKSIPIKVNVFAWKLYLDRLPTRSNLSRRNVSLPSLACPLCDHVLEDSSHLFFGCSVAKDIQKLICRWFNLRMFLP
ncbi:RNA-directed DNA polymerase, eukaryota [Tanacetum coccineum]